jgi:uncharacterized membrane protein (Fun14 family)
LSEACAFARELYLVFSAGGEFIIDTVAGYAIRGKKIAAVVIGLFVIIIIIIISYLSYRGWMDVKRMEIENATMATLSNVAGLAVHALNNTAT